MTETSANGLDFEAPELPCHQVTVFSDRAEVKRRFKATISAGPNEVVVKKLPQTIDSDSLRVEGTGAAVICEVQYQTKHLTDTDAAHSQEKRKELDMLIKSLELKRDGIDRESKRAQRQWDIMDGIAEQVQKGHKADKADANILLGQNLHGAIDDFLVHYDEKIGALDAKLAEKRAEKEAVEQEIQAARRNLRQIGGDGGKISREVSILLEGKEAGEVELTLTYVVHNASWQPSYDVRVFTQDKKPQLTLQYYGQVQQSSGEDWNDCKLCLSTAQPSVGGAIPILKTLHVSIRPPVPVYVSKRKIRATSMAAVQDVKATLLRVSSQVLERSERITEEDYAAPVAFEQVEVNESVISTAFEIARPASIPSDNTEHKVNVGIVELEPALEYWSVPTKSSSAYLKARVLNASKFALLAGPCSVFLDNNFVAKSDIRAVSPNETFTVSLGVDFSVRVDYKPVNKYRQETGMITKSTVEIRSQKIVLKNTRSDGLKLTLLDQIPLSHDEKLKVSLLAPPLSKEGKEKVVVNKDNNLEWELHLGAGEERNLEIRYSIEVHKKENLEFSEY